MVICQHYRLQKKLLCVLEILFLGTFDKKRGTVHDIVGNFSSQSNIELIASIFTVYVIYFCIAEKHVLMKCLLIYLDTERAFTECRILKKQT